ncbi:MAG: hypothetical protein NUV63_02980 [Gallionella sp.]|nr:hypothetical protein [Gallionella sp.]
MALRGKEVRPLIDHAMHERLAIMAEHKDMQINELAASLLEKSIAGEWHQVSVLIRRSERLGKRWRVVDDGADGA